MNNFNYMNDLSKLLSEVKNYLKRADEQQVTANDNNIMLQLLAAYQETFSDYQELDVTEENSVAIAKILSGIKDMADGLTTNDKQKFTVAYEMLTGLDKHHQMLEKRMEKIAAIFQSDAAALQLNSSKLETMQELVNMDLSIYGEIATDTLNILDSQHYTIDENNKIIEKQEEEMQSNDIEKTPMSQVNEIIDAKEQSKTILTNDERNLLMNYAYKTNDSSKAVDLVNKVFLLNLDAKQNEPMQSDLETKEDRNKEQSYQGSAYLKGNGGKQKPTVLYGNSPEAIISVLQGWNKARTEDMQFTNCYIRKLNTETNNYDNPARYEVATGKDITPIYLSIPYMSKDKFTKTVAELKANGAKYNPVKKAFYITKQDDLNKFANYIPISGTHVQEGENHGKDELSYEVETGQEYYDNRILEADKEINEVPKEVEFNGKQYNPLQYEVLQLAVKQNFTPEQLQLLERPELTSDRMNEIRFAIRDGLSKEQISYFATPTHEQWQMDMCRIGMQHGLTYDELKPVINPDDYTPDKWGERRNQLSAMIKEKEHTYDASKNSNMPHLGHNNHQNGKNSVLSKLRQNEAVVKQGENLPGNEKHRSDITQER